MAAASILTRSRLVSLAVVGGLLAGGAVWLTEGSGPKAPKVSFWQAVPSGHVDEMNTPKTVGAITKGAEAAVVAHVTDVTDGRIEVPHYYDKSIPPEDMPGGGIRTWYVHLTVDRVVKGSVVKGATLKWEVSAPPRPLTPEALKPGLPPGPFLVFLYNRGTGIVRSGFGATMDPIERELWTLASQVGLIGENTSGLYEVLHYSTGNAFVRSFRANTVDEAANSAAESLR